MCCQINSSSFKDAKLADMIILRVVIILAAKSLQSCPTLRNPIDGSPPGSAVSGILQARTLEWVTISFSNAWKWKVKVRSLSRVRLFKTPWTVAYQAFPSMGFSRQEYWSGMPLPSPLYSLNKVLINTHLSCLLMFSLSNCPWRRYLFIELKPVFILRYCSFVPAK